MNVTDLMQTYFGDAETEQLGRAAGLDLLSAQRALGVGVPLTLDALADHAASPAGQTHVAEAIDNLPRFGSVQEALAEADGAANLQQAGEFLSPVLLGGQDERIAAAATASAGPAASPDGVRRLLQMTLPLLLSFLAQRGLGRTNMGLLRDLRGGVPGAATDAAPVMTARSVPQAAPAPVAGVLSASVLLDHMKAQFSGQNAERIGAAAGFGGGAQRATLTTLPVVLNALVNKGRTEAGAADLISQARSYLHLTDADGNLDLSSLDDPAETGRLEVQGRGLLTGLFGNVNEITGRLGTALGGSGTSAGRLLSLVTPLALSLLGRRAQAAGLNAERLSAVLGGLSGSSLAGLLPAGLTGLSSLLGNASAAAVAAAPASSAAPIHTAPVAASTPASHGSSTSTTSTDTVAVSRRRGFPWWLIPLLLLVLLGGYWLLQTRQGTTTRSTTDTATTTGAITTDVVVESPVAGSTIPAAPFTMRGTAPASTTVSIREGEEEVAQATADPEGRWNTDMLMPAPGEHTYSVQAGDASSEVRVNVVDAASISTRSNTDTGTETDETDTAADDSAQSDSAGQSQDGDTETQSSADTTAGTAAPITPAESQEFETTDPAGEETSDSVQPAGTGDMTVIGPATGTTLPAGGFTLRGTGAQGQEAELFEDDTSLGRVTVGEDGRWSFDVPSPSAGPHTYSLRSQDGNEIASVRLTTSAATAGAATADCTEDFSLSIADGQTVSEPFRFGGKGQGSGYDVTVRRGARVIGTRKVALDGSCGWSYESKPGPGTITYEVRPAGDATAEPVSTVNLTVGE
ncbi:DUF937 domain-containing protein [Deinococcus deserti]|uniref:DUF937 domain-containing protein n=1 Tax=Deinococcus deserti (strain DSM 17065 / CIP 109153 / LMG 22923 / VCD115) TaxID=546414 RepID=C1D039_DEIDV|nr:DUF937 domain-containing protein [Deinococcus deserti]ACO45291.1 hypothetical protein Deide_04602 [Deinococcus deserti VCD115]